MTNTHTLKTKTTTNVQVCYTQICKDAKHTHTGRHLPPEGLDNTKHNHTLQTNVVAHIEAHAHPGRPHRRLHNTHTRTHTYRNTTNVPLLCIGVTHRQMPTLTHTHTNFNRPQKHLHQHPHTGKHTLTRNKRSQLH